MNFNNLYARSPYVVQGVLLNAFAAKIHLERYGAKFQRLLDDLLDTQWHTLEQVEQYQSERLRLLVEHAYKSVPFYKNKMVALGLTPADISGVSDLGKLPILEKDDVRNNFSELISTSYDLKRLGRGNTSGTTGSPLSVVWDKHMQLFNNVVDWRQKHWAGIHYGDKVAQILGRPIVGLTRKNPPFWQTDFIHKQLWLSAFHMSPGNLKYYLEKLRSFEPAAIEGYPSTVYELAKYISDTVGTIPVRAVFTSSEPLLFHQRELIERTFQTKVFDFYGLAERAIFATQCDVHIGQHVNFEYGILEVVNSEGVAVPDGEEGVMVGTSLQNFGMPLIRYRIGDRTSYLADACPCGRPMKRIQGVASKHEDQIVRPDGTVISASVLTHPFKPISTIEKSQIIQYASDGIEIKIVRRPAYSDNDESKLLDEFRKRVGGGFKVAIAYVDDIPRTKSGKYRWVINSCSKRS